MGKNKTKHFLKRGENSSVFKDGKFIFVFREDGMTDIYRRVKRSCVILIASDVVKSYRKNGYLFFLCQNLQQKGWSCIKYNASKVIRLGEAVGDFFALWKKDGTYALSFFNEKKEIRKPLLCSNYFFDTNKGLLAIEKTDAPGSYQLWESRNIWKVYSMTMASSDTVYFSPVSTLGISDVYILRDIHGVDIAFVACPPYSEGSIKKRRIFYGQAGSCRGKLHGWWLIFKDMLFEHVLYN